MYSTSMEQSGNSFKLTIVPSYDISYTELTTYGLTPGTGFQIKSERLRFFKKDINVLNDLRRNVDFKEFAHPFELKPYNSAKSSLLTYLKVCFRLTPCP